MDPALWEIMTRESPVGEIEAIIKLANPETLPKDARVVAQFGDIATCRLQVGNIREVWSDEVVVSLKAPRFVGMEPVIGEIETFKGTYPTQNPTSFTGKGILIGIIDWGFDFTHPNFLNPDGSTRFLAIWDQTTDFVPAGNRYGYGKIYTRQQINVALKTASPFDTLGYHPAWGDPEASGAHGTHVTDIAAGNGSVGERGIAPEAELIGVHLSAGKTGGLATLGDSVRILEAIDFLGNKAGERPLVVNLSVGKHGGAHQGNSLVEQGMDNFLKEKPGRAIVNSAGNYFSAQIHASGRIAPGASATLDWEISKQNRSLNELEIWYPRRDRMRLKMELPGAEEHPVAVDFGEKKDITLKGKVVGRVYHRSFEPNTGDHNIDIFLYKNAPRGSWRLTLEGLDVVDGRWHAWIERDGVSQSKFADQNANPGFTTGSICNGMYTLAVGAYDPSNQQREAAFFSSAGPTADGRKKPNLLAPGTSILAARSAPAGSHRSKGELTTKSGTSMAAPHVTGAIALLFESVGHPLPIETTRRLLLTSLDPPPKDRRRAYQYGEGFLNVASLILNATHYFSQKTSTAMEHYNGFEEEVPEEGAFTAWERGFQEIIAPATLDCEKQVKFAKHLKDGKKKNIWFLPGSTTPFFQAGMAIDADGAPNAYHPNNIGIDYNANAGIAPGKTPYGIVLDASGTPCIQNARDPYPGYYVSGTSLQNQGSNACDPSRYANSNSIRYIALPIAFRQHLNVSLGDFATVIHCASGRVAHAVFADGGPKYALGEGSIALAQAIGHNPFVTRNGIRRALSGIPDNSLIYLIYPGSGRGQGYVPSNTEIDNSAAPLFANWGGIAKLKRCFPGCAFSAQNETVAGAKEDWAEKKVDDQWEYEADLTAGVISEEAVNGFSWYNDEHELTNWDYERESDATEECECLSYDRYEEERLGENQYGIEEAWDYSTANLILESHSGQHPACKACGEYRMEQAEAWMHSAPTEDFLGRLLPAHTAEAEYVSIDRPFSIGARELFDHWVLGKTSPLDDIRKNQLEVVTMPKTRLTQPFLPGDMVICRSLGDGNAWQSVAVDGRLLNKNEAEERGLSLNSNKQGLYIEVLTMQPLQRTRGSGFAQRIGDEWGRLLPDCLVMRGSQEKEFAEEQYPDFYSDVAERDTVSLLDLRDTIFRRPGITQHSTEADAIQSAWRFRQSYETVNITRIATGSHSSWQVDYADKLPSPPATDRLVFDQANEADNRTKVLTAFGLESKVESFHEAGITKFRCKIVNYFPAANHASSLPAQIGWDEKFAWLERNNARRRAEGLNMLNFQTQVEARSGRKGTYYQVKILGVPPFGIKTIFRSRWHNIIKGTTLSPAESLVDGKDAFKSMVDAIKNVEKDKGHYIYILGWMLDIDFELIAGDPSSTLLNLLTEATKKGVEVRILVWKNLLYVNKNMRAYLILKNISNIKIVLDDKTFGSTTVKNAVSSIKSVISEINDKLNPGLWDTIASGGLLGAVGAGGLYAARKGILSLLSPVFDFVKNLPPNEGSHHEKMLIVKGKDGLVGFCGGLDINQNRLTGLHDVQCRVGEHAAWESLQRFIKRWEVHPGTANIGLRGKAEIEPNPAKQKPGNSFVKILHTYNQWNSSHKVRTIKETIILAIRHAKKSFYMEDQYMVSLEIAMHLNRKLQANELSNVEILIQADAKTHDILFPKKKRLEFINQLEFGLTPAQKQRINIQMLNLNSSVHKEVHSKLIIVDDELAIIGSANCNRRSLTHDSETSAVIFDDPGGVSFAKKLREDLRNHHKPYLTPYVRNSNYQDFDEKIMNHSGWQVAAAIPGIGSIVTSIKQLLNKLWDFIWEVVDPHDQ